MAENIDKTNNASSLIDLLFTGNDKNNKFPLPTNNLYNDARKFQNYIEKIEGKNLVDIKNNIVEYLKNYNK